VVRIPKQISLLVVVALATGCAGTKVMKPEKMSQALKEAVHLTPKAAPATEFQCGWQKSLAQLPDPTRNGTMIPGLVGQVFIFTADLKPAEITGELMVSAHDTTMRPNGSARQPNAWHFTAETLKNLVIMDDRFGKSWVLFLPWPEDWTDVREVEIQARYDQPTGHTLYAQPAKITLEAVKVNGRSNVVPTGGMSVPDATTLMKNRVPTSDASGIATAKNTTPPRRSVHDDLGPARYEAKVSTLPAGGVPPPGNFVQQASANIPLMPPTFNANAKTAPQVPPATTEKDMGRIVIPRGPR
jgi:hypothetical protein